MNVLGLMSGTSLDGLDLALVRFSQSPKLQFEFLATKTIPYTEEWKSRLFDAFFADRGTLQELEKLYGIWLGEQVLVFREEFNLSIDLIGSHGHTIFHRPQEGYTLQIGSGKEIYHQTGIPVVCNFRQQDVALGGQGAPLVPIGDEMLFSEFQFCLNLGGFSNISWNLEGLRKACDISPCNMLLNNLSQRIGLNFDEGGKLAREGKVLSTVLDRWNALNYYHLTFPKSLGREWFEVNFKNDLNSSAYRIEDLLRTSVEHIAFQIHHFIEALISISPEKRSNQASVLCTGGGTYNDFLLERLNSLNKTKWKYIIPNSTLIDCKEALVFALLAYLKWNDRINVLSSVTGALRDHSSGDVYKDFNHNTGSEEPREGE